MRRGGPSGDTIVTGRRSQRGQSMVEYTIVVSLGLMVAVGPGTGVIRDLVDAVRFKYEGYSYAISLSEIPDAQRSLAPQAQAMWSRITSLTRMPPMPRFPPRSLHRDVTGAMNTARGVAGSASRTIAPHVRGVIGQASKFKKLPPW